MEPRFFTPAEVAERLKVSTTSVLRWIHEGRLPAVRASERVYRVPVSALAVFESERSAEVVTVPVRRVRGGRELGRSEKLPAAAHQPRGLVAG